MATLVVVRRGASETFHHLQGTWAPKLGSDLTLMWDRRTDDRRGYENSIEVERRVGERCEATEPAADLGEARRSERRQRAEAQLPDHRQAERRRRAPDTWGALGFLVVHDEGPP